MSADVAAPPDDAAAALLLAVDPGRIDPPGYAEDLRLQDVVDAVTAGRDEYRLDAYFWLRLDDPTLVRRRQDVFRDLQRETIRQAVDRFAASMRESRKGFANSEKLYYAGQKQAWFLRAMAAYVAGADRLLSDLRVTEPASAALRTFTEWLGRTLGSDAHRTLRNDAERVQRGLDSVRYTVRIHGSRVRVTRDPGAADYSQEITETFARFGDADGKSYLAKLPDSSEMNHVEARILDGVAELHSEVFGDLAEFCRKYEDGVDAGLRRFDREVQFFVAYLDLVHELEQAGLSFSYPDVSDDAKEVRADGTFDLALAIKRVREHRDVVTNDVLLTGEERILLVSGPNQGGKTTLARTVGQLHHLAALGCPVPGQRTRLFLCDHLLTHFEREEDASSLRGKLEDDLLRMRAILDQATPRSLIVLNEVFTSTAMRDALFLSREMLRRINALDALCVCVTFLDELSRETPTAVSMVSTVVPGDPATRTFKVVRRRADGLAYAVAIADKYGLSYERIRQRLAS